MNEDTKVCKLVNGIFSWSLEADGKTVHFVGSDVADLFADLYTKLGYTIEWNRNQWQIDSE